MKYKNIFFLFFLLIGSTIGFFGLPVSEVQPQEVVTQQYVESMALISFLAILGVAIFIIIRLLEALTKLDLWNRFIEAYNLNPRKEYIVSYNRVINSTFYQIK